MHGLGGVRPVFPLQQRVEQMILLDIRGDIAFKDHLAIGRSEVPLFGKASDFLEIGFALNVRKPGDLEEIVAFHHTAGVIVNRFTRSREQSCRGVVVTHDEIGIRLGTLQGDPDRHLAERASRETVRAAQGLRAKQNMNAKRAALSDQAIQKQRGVLRDFVILDEELLKFVDDEQHPGHVLFRTDRAEPRDILDFEFAKQLAALFQFQIDTLEHTQTEFTIALNGNHPGVRQLPRGVGLEFHALLEIHQVKLYFIRTAPERKIRDQCVQECGLARTGLAGDQCVLGCAVTEHKGLEFRRPGTTQRHLDFIDGAQ